MEGGGGRGKGRGWQVRGRGGGRGGGGRRSSPTTMRWAPRPQSPIQTPPPPPPPPVTEVVADQNSASSHDNNNNHNSPDCGLLLSDHVSNKLTISETETETKTETETETKPLVFDICPPKSTSTVVLKPTLFHKNREIRRQQQRNINVDTPNGSKVLRPGMVILKDYLSLTDQVNIVKRCRELGLGCGGFCQPGYREGTKLQLKMMCLGKSWDPQTGQYTDNRLSDGAKAPEFPLEFNHLVEKAIEDSHALIKQHSETKNPHKILPSMSPSICIVNFYTQSGRLGLHRDKDESEESLHNGLPVVSFSIGDSADFLYGDESDVDKAQKVVLESGDVLIFGGKSRHVFHGVTAIYPTTAPQLLLEETNLRPGRLNLTFRQY